MRFTPAQVKLLRQIADGAVPKPMNETVRRVVEALVFQGAVTVDCRDLIKNPHANATITEAGTAFLNNLDKPLIAASNQQQANQFAQL